MDAFSEALRFLRLDAAVFVDACCTAPWRHQPAMPAERPAATAFIFHMVTEGECWLGAGGEPARRLSAGDVVVLPQALIHRMGSEPGPDPARAGGPAARMAEPRPIARGGGAVTRLVCGRLTCDARMAGLLLGDRAGVVRVNVRDTPAGRWLEASLAYAMDATRSERAGSGGVLASLAEALLAEVLRLHFDQQGQQGQQRPAAGGWLAGLRDRTVGKALEALHGDPSHPWDLEQLARQVGASRSVLAERFQRVVGASPIQHLTRWRMVTAANLLRGSDARLGQIARRVGYRTDTAFIRAFRRAYGMPPATWRRGLVAAGGPRERAQRASAA